MPEGQADPRHTSYVPEPEPEAAPAPAPESERVIASHLGTVHTDALLHQRTPSLGAVRDNETVPNRYRILVRVREVLGRGARGSRPGDLALLWCRKCRRPFPESHCRSCEDTAYKHAEARWQLVLRLEDEAGGELIVALSGESLPSLPFPALHTLPVSAHLVHCIPHPESRTASRFLRRRPRGSGRRGGGQKA